MSKFFTTLCASLCVYSGLALNADASFDSESMPAFPPLETIQFPIEESNPSIAAPQVVAEPKAALKKIADKPEVNVNPFTGKIKGRKVRMRLRPDLDSRIIKELTKNDLVTVVAEKGEFWAVQPLAGTKVYVFRSFILDNVVEGNRVNVRLEPSLDAPVVAHMNSGEKLDNPVISPINTKWLEITPPPQTRFYISKEFVEYAGGPEVKAQLDRRLATAEQLLDASSLLSKSELRKSFEDIDFDRIVRGYNAVITDYSDFPELVEQAKESLTAFQESYLQKRITYLESPQEHFAASKQGSKKGAAKKDLPDAVMQITDKMKYWQPIEEALYLSWANINENKTETDYYQEQKLASVEISGIIETYNSLAKNKPGDFIIRDKELGTTCVYSTQVNLQSLVGKHVKLVAAPRPNNNFAFPAYYVLAIE